MIEVATPEEVLAVVRAVHEAERVVSRLHKAWPDGSACAGCGVTNLIPLGRRSGRSLCYRCRVRRSAEQHSVVGDHAPPRVPTDPNDHKVLDVVQGIMAVVIAPGVGIAVASNTSAWLALQLAGLGTLRAAA